MGTIFSKYDPLVESLSKTAYVIQKSDLEQAAKVMSAAFNNDPSIRYLLGGKCEGRNDWRYFETVIKAIYGKCIILSSDNYIQNLLILFPPTLKSVGTLDFFRNGGIGLCKFFGFKLLLRSFNYENNCRHIKNRFFTPETWYCMCFVVKPEIQGLGLGSQLIKPVLSLLDERHIPLYLETHKEINTHIYEHLGFRVVDISTIPGTVTKQYGMLRQTNNQIF